MPSILNLKFKGNKSFVAFSNLNDTESLTKTWKVCTKVASYLEQGQRLENLSWRLWHLQNLMVDTDNAKSKREFKKLSKCMGDKLDKEKGRSIEELEAPDFKRNHSTDMIRKRAVEKERNREASHNALPGTIKRMQFTFSIDQPTPALSQPVKKPNLRPSTEFNKRPTRAAPRTVYEEDDHMVIADDERHDKDPPPDQRPFHDPTAQQTLRFPPLFSNDFGPLALLYATPTLTNPMNYGEGLNTSRSHDFSIMRPTIELPLDELLNETADSPDIAQYNQYRQHYLTEFHDESHIQNHPLPPLPQEEAQEDIYVPATSNSPPPVVAPLPTPAPTRKVSPVAQESESESSESSDDESSEYEAHRTTSTSSRKRTAGFSQAAKDVPPETVAPSKINLLFSNRSSTPVGRPALTVRTQGAPSTRSAGPGATATSVNSAVLRQHNNSSSGGNSAPGGVKAECTNCGATHTPLWRRGLNDELNCNACGLYCKLHKRPRPKSMRSTHGEGRAQVVPRQEPVDVMGASSAVSPPTPKVPQRSSSPVHRTAQCYNCHTTATPLWRKDDEGKTVCNACGLYYKLHGSARPISMKSDIIRKRSRHDARRGSGMPDTPSASPDVSRRTSPAREASPTLAPDSTTQMSYDYHEDIAFPTSQSELLGALGHDLSQFQSYLPQMYTISQNDPLPFAAEPDPAMSPRSNKRRRMSTDSASEPPSSATSYSSYNDGYSSASSATSHSQRSSMEFPFSSYLGAGGSNGNGTVSSPFSSGPVLRGSGNTFWHPPMMPQGQSDMDASPNVFHPPMLPPTHEDSPMDYLHPPMLAQDDESLFSTFLHPPMVVPEEQSHQPIYPNEWSGHDSYDASMRAY